MKRLLLCLTLAGGAWFVEPALLAQSSSQGSNYDPAQRTAAQTAPATSKLEPEKPIELLAKIDWARRDTWVKAALLLGSLLLALRAFRELQD